MTTQIVDILGYEGRYQVTSDGRILSLPNCSRKNIRELKQETLYRKKARYKRVTLCKEGKVKRFLVHRLVCSAFHPNPKNKPQVNHIDNNGEHNDYRNLEWATGKENMTHSAKQGRQELSRLLGQKAAAKIAHKDTLQKMKQKLGKRLIKIERPKPGRCFITFRCKHCGNIYTKRSDTPAIQRNGVCRECINR